MSSWIDERLGLAGTWATKERILMERAKRAMDKAKVISDQATAQWMQTHDEYMRAHAKAGFCGRCMKLLADCTCPVPIS